jgi:hypothetical protein
VRRATGLPVAISAGLAFALSSISTKLVSDGLANGEWGAIIGWAIATGLAAAVATASEMTALQSRGATEVAPLVFVIQLLVPALLAPVLVHEPWDATPLGGAVLAVSLLVVAAGSALLAGSRVVSAFTSGAPPEPGDAAPTASRDVAPDAGSSVTTTH